MREILFRGIDEGTNEWVYGYYYEKPSDFGGEKRYYIFDDKTISKYNVLPETVGQYTDLTDKNGKKIFEGDIVILDEDVKRMFDVDDGEVKYGRGGFYVKEFGMLNSLNALTSWDWVLRGEVIGNIHDNPELLNI